MISSNGIKNLRDARDFASALGGGPAQAKLWNRIYDISTGGSDTTITWLLLGDSLGSATVTHVAAQLEAMYRRSGTQQRGMGGFSAIVQNDTLTYSLENSATISLKSRYDWMPSGSYVNLAAAGDAVRFSDDTLLAAADTLKLYYLRTSGGGTFKVQSSSTSPSSGFTDEAGYTSVDANNATDGLGVITINKPLGKYALRVECLSGSVKILGCALYESTTNNFLWYGESPGSNDGSSYQESPVIDAFISDLDPDVISYQCADELDATINALDKIKSWVDNSSIEAPSVVIVSQHGKASYDMTDVNKFVAKTCLKNGWLWVDGLGFTGGSYAAATDHGWEGDGIHYEAKAYEYVAEGMMQALRLPALNRGYTTTPLRLAHHDEGVENHVKSLAISSAQANHGTPAAVIGTDNIFGVDVSMTLKGIFTFFDDSGNKILEIRSDNGKITFSNPSNSRTFTIDTSNSSLDTSEIMQINRFSAGYVHFGASSNGKVFAGQHVVPSVFIPFKMAIGSEQAATGGLIIGGPRPPVNGTVNLFEVVDYLLPSFPYNGNARFFAIGPDGELKTNQTSSNTNVPAGSTSHQLKIHDEDGTLIGYVPVYDAPW